MKRLPVKSLIRFRSVSKSWKSYIDSSDFITKYNSGPHHHLLVEFGKEIYMSCIDDDTFLFSQITAPVFPSASDYRIVGMSYGLLCFYSDNKDMCVIWNPSIRKSVNIAVPNLIDQYYETVIGFGVCPNTLDPKIVKITYTDDVANKLCDVEVVSLSSGVSKILLPSSDCDLFSGTIKVGWSQVVMDRFIYWCAVDDDQFHKKKNLIVSFDMISEQFSVIRDELPDRLADQNPYSLSLSKLRDSVVVLEYNLDTGRRAWVVWMMMEDGVSKAFTKLYTIGLPYASVRQVQGFTKSGASIIEIEDYNYVMSSMICVFEPITEHIRVIGIYGRDHSFTVNTHPETLLLLDG